MLGITPPLHNSVRGLKTEVTNMFEQNDSLSSRSEGGNPRTEQPRCELFVVKCLVALI